MNDAEAIAHFQSLTGSLVRDFTLADALPYLRGLLILTEDRPELDHLRSVYSQLSTADAQLELIASGQLRLPLAPASRPAALTHEHRDHYAGPS